MTFFLKSVFLRFIEFHGLQDDLKIIWKTFNPWHVQKICPSKKRRLTRLERFARFRVMSSNGHDSKRRLTLHFPHHNLEKGTEKYNLTKIWNLWQFDFPVVAKQRRRFKDGPTLIPQIWEYGFSVGKLCSPGNQDYQKIIHFYFLIKKGRDRQCIAMQNLYFFCWN
mgnify:CR=1 FL=1